MPNTTRLTLATLFLALAPYAAQAAESDKVKFRYDMDETAFRAANKRMLAEGLRIADLTIAEFKGKTTIAAVWQVAGEAASPERVEQLQSLLYLRQTRAELTATATRMYESGSMIEVLDAYDIGGKNFYAVVFSPPKEPAMASVVPFLNAEQAADAREKAQAEGADFMRFEVAMEGSEMLSFPSFTTRPETGMDGIEAENQLQFNANRVKMDFAGMQPMSISVYRGKTGYGNFMGLFDDFGVEREVILDLPLDEFRAKVDPLIAKGAMMMDIDSFSEEDGVKYSAVVVSPQG
jgi:hypothetical protein